MSAKIDVQEALRGVPHFEHFCSVKQLHELVDSLRSDPRFAVSDAGKSVGGLPIHHVRFGSGSVKALIVGSPHCNEPIGGLTVFALLTLLRQGNRALVQAPVEWHIVPCIDPDGVLLNEGWTQQAFDFDRYMRGYYIQEFALQVDGSFPVEHKNMSWDQPSCEARILQTLLDTIQPHFYFSLHNTRTGGPFYYLSRDIGSACYEEFRELSRRERFPIQTRPQWREVLAQFAPGVTEMPSLRKYYDYLERGTPSPEKEEILRYGVSSMEYLAQTQPRALTFVAEMGYVMHPQAESERDTGRNLRQFSLRLDADNKYLASVLLEEWEKVKPEVATQSPLYRSVLYGWVLPDRQNLCEGGMPVSRYPTRDILFSPRNDRTMTEADLLNACMVDGGFLYHLYSYQFVRLLRASAQTPAVQRAIERVERVFTDAHTELARHVNFSEFVVIPCDTLARTQLGSGLIVLNSLL